MDRERGVGEPRLLDGENELLALVPDRVREAARLLPEHCEAVYPLADCEQVIEAIERHSMSLRTITLYVTQADGSLFPDGWEEMPGRASSESRRARATKYLARCRKFEGKLGKSPYYLAFFFVERP